MEENKKAKLILPMLVAVFTLGALVIGATFAFINAGITNNYGTYTITSSVPSTGSAAITAGTNLTMNLTAAQVEKKTSNQTYYASTTGTTTTDTTVNVATITAATGTLSCSYTMNIKANPATMATQSVSLGAGLFVLTVKYFDTAGTQQTATYDFNNAYTGSNQINNTSGVSLSGKVTVTNSTPKNITAQLKFVNSSTIDQSKLAGTSATFNFTVTAFNCTAA